MLANGRLRRSTYALAPGSIPGPRNYVDVSGLTPAQDIFLWHSSMEVRWCFDPSERTGRATSRVQNSFDLRCKPMRKLN